MRIEVGTLLPMNIGELQVRGSALVTAIDDCPEIAGASQPAALRASPAVTPMMYGFHLRGLVSLTFFHFVKTPNAINDVVCR